MVATMVIIPRGKQIAKSLNSYYLKIDNLLEHYQGELGSGGIFFSSSAGKGVLFFDQDEILSGYYQNRNEELVGKEAIGFLLNPPSHQNFSVSVYAIDPEDVYYWTSIPGAKMSIIGPVFQVPRFCTTTSVQSLPISRP
jgi:hypothetical protein